MRTLTTRVGVLLVCILTPACSQNKSPDDRQTLQPFVDRALVAAGGAEKLRSIRGWQVTWKRVIDNQSDTCHTVVELPKRIRRECETVERTNRTTRIWIINGNQGWTSFNGNFVPLNASEIPGQVRNIEQELSIRGALLLSDSNYRLVSLPDVKDRSRSLVGIQLTHSQFSPIRLYFDQETAFLHKYEVDETDPGEQRVTTYEFTLSDVRRIDGIPVAHKRTIKSSNGTTHEDEFTEFRFIENADPKLFVKP